MYVRHYYANIRIFLMQTEYFFQCYTTSCERKRKIKNRAYRIIFYRRIFDNATVYMYVHETLSPHSNHDRDETWPRKNRQSSQVSTFFSCKTIYYIFLNKHTFFILFKCFFKLLPAHWGGDSLIILRSA